MSVVAVRSRSALGGIVTLALLASACQSALPTPAPQAVPTVEGIAAGGIAAAAVSVARADLAQGTAESRANAQSQWQPVTGSFDINPGTELRTGPQGHLNMAFIDGSRLALDPSSQLGLDLFETDGPPDAITARLVRIRLQNASLSFDIKPVAGAASVFQFRTDDQVADIRGTSGTISSQAAPAAN